MNFELDYYANPARGAVPAADTAPGAAVFRVCIACHTLEPDRNLTGPSLAGVWARKAGTLPSFHRYSEALKSSGIVWDATSLDAWLENPAKLVPGNSMPFPGIPNDADRGDLIAYLKEASAAGGAHGHNAEAPQMPDLRKLAPHLRVTKMTYCGDTYRVTTAEGKTYPIWEFNLRFKTDSSDRGPKPGSPALLGAAMRGDRAFVVFSSPGEIGNFIKEEC